jgi:hypothetical protein
LRLVPAALAAAGVPAALLLAAAVLTPSETPPGRMVATTSQASKIAATLEHRTQHERQRGSNGAKIQSLTT